MDRENLRKQISKTFFSYETEYGKKCIDETMTLIDKHVEQQLKLYGVSQQRELLSWMKKNNHLGKTEEQINELLLDYNFEKLNCG